MGEGKRLEHRAAADLIHDLHVPRKRWSSLAAEDLKLAAAALRTSESAGEEDRDEDQTELFAD
jgi:hypothetical protein